MIIIIRRAFLFYLIALVCIPVAINATSNVTLGSKLLPGEKTGWVSFNNSFQLAFYAVDNSASYSVGIMYVKAGVDTTTVVWTAGGDAQVGKSGSFELSSDGNLVLMNDSSTTVWSSSTGGVGVTAASMLDSGNFVLYNSSGGFSWQSFANPTDTLVMNQQLTQGKSLTAGSYSATMEATGNLSLIYNNTIIYTYWYSNTDSTSAYASLQSTSLGVFNKQGKAIKTWYSDDYTVTSVEVIRRVTLDIDGNLRIYSWSVGSSTVWSVGWQAVQDQCQVYGYCGPNGLCSYNSTGISCQCAEQAGYDFIDGNNPRRGCKAITGNGGQNCKSSAKATMVDLNNTQLFISDRNLNYGNSGCRRNCLEDDSCTAATALNDGSRSCFTVQGTTFSGYQELSISANSFLKYCGTPPTITAAETPSPSSKKTSAIVPVIAAVLATLAVIVLVQGAVWYFFCRKSPRFGGYSAHYAILEYASGAPVQLSYRELKSATQNFQEKLGEGGFGAVYKGSLPSGGGSRTEVAVKRLEGIDQGEKQFRMEVAVIGSTHHMNLVRLSGFCAEGKHRLLVYEYMKNGSLDRYLFAEGQDDLQTLDWETRFNVLVGAARGITYLHQECRDCIIHCDIKPENILLDDNFSAKVSDFGLAKLTNAKDRARNVTTLVRGTRGYLAPEWRSNLPITVKSDVFSFGMVVLETISGKKSFDTTSLQSSASTSRQSFSAWAYRQYFEHNQMEGIVDPRISEQVDMGELDRALKVAFWCMQVQPSLRPSMSKVIQMLEGTLPLGPPPTPKPLGEAFTIEEAATFRVLEQESSPATRTSHGSTTLTSTTPSASTASSGLSISSSPLHKALSQGFMTQTDHGPPTTRTDGGVPYSF